VASKSASQVDFGHIEWALTIDDPEAFLKPWGVNIPLPLAADSELLEAF
jgi:hypothetical protein